MDKIAGVYQENILFKRYEGNPVLMPSMWPYRVNAVFNAAATLFEDKVLLLIRVEDMRGFSHLCKATSVDGFTDLEDRPASNYAAPAR